MKCQWKGESEVRQQVIKQSRCRLSISLKAWFTESKYRGKWNLLVQGQPLTHQTHAPGCGFFCGGGNSSLSVRGSYLMWTKTTPRHGMSSVCRSLWAELPCWSCSQQESQLNLWAWSGKQWLFSFTLSEWPPWRQINRSDRGRESHVAELSASQKGEFDSSLSSQLSQLFWNPLTFLPVREWKHTPFIPELSGGVLSAVPLLSWPDCLLSEKTIKSPIQGEPVWVRAV